MALNLIAHCLRRSGAAAENRPNLEGMGRRRSLHVQPWRHSRRQSFTPLSVMEIIRRYEASHGLN